LAPFIITSYFIYIELISSLLDPRPVDLGSTLIHVGAYDPKNLQKVTINLNPICRFYKKEYICQMVVLNALPV